MTRAEFGVSYSPMSEKEILPSPKFEGVYWQGFPEENQLTGQRVSINGQAWVIEVVGFQGSEGRGSVQMHQEPLQQEDVFFLVGSGEMTIWNGQECQRRPEHPNYWGYSLNGVMTNREAQLANYVLAVASGLDSREEKLVLNVTKKDGTMIAIEPVSTHRGRHHSTRLDASSLYFVVKRSPIQRE